MKEWWQSKKRKTTKRKVNNNYSLFELLLDVLFWLPELFLVPFRLVFWLLRGIGRLIADVFEYP
ncbi:hypothetical protein ACE1MS_16115 [Lysinibacillus sp. fkY74-1]|uniref:Uncharacterized protein n=2 Tax=Lysinibacillus TaxID=400634 RepID=W7S566_LYSSH|nr:MULTISPECIES: hypothetical protein [Lysinibacillus]MBE5082756.1 hypothetical protein [Bacillus thuringiensis]AMO32648.1 hypothetical protein AR327_09500 [Lysinibacillus sphaericus]AMR92250.1 hypothetical protein A1T07_19710 [Lysinibacillus sphaericus]ANA46299.1 hypothetical protein A2J09_12380 [Lysinibacillus sphaericus]EWH33351.1 hypothetical protein P799_15155 [Lysinibacillus sphaericus CBAM5]